MGVGIHMQRLVDNVMDPILASYMFVFLLGGSAQLYAYMPEAGSCLYYQLFW